MNGSSRGVCRCRSSRAESFDAEKAYERLAKKHLQLSELVAKYMGEADLDRPSRNRNARRMARILERIVGGRPVEEGGFSGCCLVGERLSDITHTWFCTGVLIHPEVVITAAHCLDLPSNYTVALNTNNVLDVDQSEIISARRTVIHPDYPATGLHDIGVMILRRESSVTPFEIATPTELNEADKTQLVGFGNDDAQSTSGFGTKREVDVPITAIRRSPDDDLDDEEERLGFESDLEFVAGGNGFDSCNGDSGGPAYICVDGQFKVAGLTSRATDVATAPCGDGGIYTRVDVHLDFIQEVMRSAGVNEDDDDVPVECTSEGSRKRKKVRKDKGKDN